MIKQVNRRIVLKGMGGAVVAAPFLSSLFEKKAKAQDLPAAGTPKRLIVMFTHYGCITNEWFPAKLDGDLAAADLTGTSLEVLAPVRGQAPHAARNAHHERVDVGEPRRGNRSRTGE